MNRNIWDSYLLKLTISNPELNHGMSEIKGAIEKTQLYLLILQAETPGPAQ